MKKENKEIGYGQELLYPPKTENDLVGVLTAIGAVVVALIALVLIVNHFSYAVNPNRYASGTQSMPYTTDQSTENGYAADEPDASDSVMDYAVSEDTGDAYTDDMSDAAGSDAAPSYGNVTGGGDGADAALSYDGDYVLQDSASRLLTTADLQGLSAQQLRLARNEIYARHGRIFDDETLQSYFESKDWYVGTVPGVEFTEDMLNDIEKENARFISAYESEMGYN